MAGISILLLCPANIQTVRNFCKIILANRTLAVVPGPPLEKNPYIWGAESGSGRMAGLGALRKV